MAGSTETIRVARVWIADGCIVCGLCEDTCPEVFDVQADTCTIRPTADRYFDQRQAQVIQAAQECPVEVIRVSGFNEPSDQRPPLDRSP